ncbi:glycosyltransferase family 2 protein [Flavobacterium sp. ARAG 55.4]|uniref:glycosyltransferase family 2 protein n=1 Tax=Flavobacterium sp. ARAG 55.4 TaxID=3451357 RepID=UPI003F480F77
MKKNVFLISIIIPCYNDWQYIEKAINSAISQTYSNKEIIVVDDGSNLKTKSILKELEPKITKLITQVNQGQSKARNVGIEASSGNYILVLDSDDYFEPSFCEKAMVFLENPEVKLVTSFVRIFNNFYCSDFYPNGGNLKDFLICNQAGTGSVMYRKQDFIIAGKYDETMKSGFEDWEFYIRLLKKGGTAYVIPEFLFNYRIKENSTTTRANKEKYKLLYFIYKKHKNLYVFYFEDFVHHLLNRIEEEEKAKFKNIQRVEYRIGLTILKPFRWIKRTFNMKKLL